MVGESVYVGRGSLGSRVGVASKRQEQALEILEATLPGHASTAYFLKRLISVTIVCVIVEQNSLDSLKRPGTEDVRIPRRQLSAPHPRGLR